MENYPEYIEAYFSGALSPEQRKEFEKRIEMDKNFAEEVAFYLSTKQILKEEVIREKKEWFRQLADQGTALSYDKKPAQVRKMWVYRMAAAAVFIGIIFLSFYLFLQKPASPTQMADKYIKSKFDTLPVTMGVVKDSIQEGLDLYNKGQYTIALQQFESIVQRDTSNYLPKEYAGIVYLRLGNYDKALGYFRQVEKYSLESNPGIFYQALTLLKRNHPGDKQRAQKLLQQVVDNDLEGKETAQQWLKKL
jgi:tetratricopeptide (TPR) repeat protein